MKRRPRNLTDQAIVSAKRFNTGEDSIGIVLSGGGSRAAYQVGALKALVPYFKDHPKAISMVIGSSIGAVNGLLLSAGLSVSFEDSLKILESLWVRRTFRNTFSERPSISFFRAIRMAILQYLNPGPSASDAALFNPSPLMLEIDQVIQEYGGLSPNSWAPQLSAVGVMTTVEGETRKPLLFVSSHKKFDREKLYGATFEVCYVDSLTAKHGFASAALPSVLPPVELDTKHGTVKLVDGGISQNVPVDPIARLGAEKIFVFDISGRSWWLEQNNEPLDTRPNWEIPAESRTYCVRPPATFVAGCQEPLGPVLKETIGNSRSKFVSTLGAVWPVFTLLKNKLGEAAAWEALTYVALDPEYQMRLIERGYNETTALLRNRIEPTFKQYQNYQELVKDQAPHI